jgi:hypothetical protein
VNPHIHGEPFERYCNGCFDLLAQAAAEADSLRARVDKLQAFKDYVHQRLDAAGVPADPEADKNAEHGCRIEGRLNFVEATANSLRAQLEGTEKRWAENYAGLLIAATSSGAEAALTTAQGEVAVLREALERFQVEAEIAACLLRSIGDAFGATVVSVTGPQGDSILRIPRSLANFDFAMDASSVALASTRATADAHDERVRREALEEVRAYFKQYPNAHPEIALDALAHPTKEPT